MPLPAKFGLYDPANEHDSCGVGFVANIDGRRTHQILEHGLTILKNLAHRGAVGADPKAGDGAGILLQMPDRFFRRHLDFELPEQGQYAIGMVFLPNNTRDQAAFTSIVEEFIVQEEQSVLGWRKVPAYPGNLGKSVLPTEPEVYQVAVKRSGNLQSQDDFERKLFVIRKQIERKVAESAISQKSDFYIPSLSSRLICYKGMLMADQVGEYYPDLLDEDMESAMALVHQRFSTNTFPSWDLAHPFRMIAHNGEINTLRGNMNWMAARRGSLFSEKLGEDIHKIWPVIPEGQSDSAAFDNVLELLVAGGYSMAHAMMLLIPEAWSENTLMDKDRK
ncbi:MAG: glutamate synthase subunit alpha, partial [Gammaproteobacteria bacterium]|nr:glutamate synthase subunit alpha [Gammaproteobacteria bacterium]